MQEELKRWYRMRATDEMTLMEWSLMATLSPLSLGMVVRSHPTPA